MDVNKIREEFPMLKQIMSGVPIVYFDNGATTFKPQCVIDSVVNSYSSLTSNIHRGDYELAYKVDKAYDDARKSVAKFINSEVNEVVFTSGDTASLNLVAYGYGATHLKKGDVILSTLYEHASSILPWFRVAEQTGATIKYIPLDSEGRVTIENFKSVMDENVKIVCLAEVSNILGYIAPIKELCEIAHENNAIVIVDGAQSVPHVKTDVKDLNCDFLTFSSHKMYGPSGVGVLFGKYDLLNETDAYLLGGGSNSRFDSSGNLLLQEVPLKFEAGTQNIEGTLGLGAACEYLMSLGMDNISQREYELKEYLLSEMKKLDNITIYNPNSDTGIISFNVNGVFAQDAAGYLSTKGVAVRSGNHCAKMLVEFLGVSMSIRASLSFYNTKEEIDRFITALQSCTLENVVGMFF